MDCLVGFNPFTCPCTDNLWGFSTGPLTHAPIGDIAEISACLSTSKPAFVCADVDSRVLSEVTLSKYEVLFPNLFMELLFICVIISSVSAELYASSSSCWWMLRTDRGLTISNWLSSTESGCPLGLWPVSTPAVDTSGGVFLIFTGFFPTTCPVRSLVIRLLSSSNCHVRLSTLFSVSQPVVVVSNFFTWWQHLDGSNRITCNEWRRNK